MLGLTSILILVGVWLVNPPQQAAPKPEGDSDVSSVDIELPPGQAAPESGQPAPDFTAVTITGETITLSALRGQPVWLVFVASWCGNCLAEAPDVEAVANQFTGRAHVISIYIGDDQETVEQYAAEVGLTHPQIPDPAKQLGTAYAAMGVPAHYFIDNDGIITAIGFGTLAAEGAIQALEMMI